MQGLLHGNFLNAKSGQNKEGAPYFMISILSGDETVRISFEPTKSSQEAFIAFSKLNRLEALDIPVEISSYNGNVYCRYDNQLLNTGG